MHLLKMAKLKYSGLRKKVKREKIIGCRTTRLLAGQQNSVGDFSMVLKGIFKRMYTATSSLHSMCTFSVYSYGHSLTYSY